MMTRVNTRWSKLYVDFIVEIVFYYFVSKENGRVILFQSLVCILLVQNILTMQEELLICIIYNVFIMQPIPAPQVPVCTTSYGLVSSNVQIFPQHM